MKSKTVICIFSKKIRPGRVKTRLMDSYTDDEAALFAKAFLVDTWNGIKSISWAQLVLAVDEVSSEHTSLCSEEFIFLQNSGSLGQRLEFVAKNIFLTLAPRAIIFLGADTPGLPLALLETIQMELSKHDAVMGPSEDGGFYALGISRYCSGMFENIAWSMNTTGQETLRQLKKSGFSTLLIQPWFDIDLPTDLVRLEKLLHDGKIQATQTHALIKKVGLR